MEFYVDNQKFSIEKVYSEKITIPDSFVKRKNKVGKAHGEAKLYFKNKEIMRNIFGGVGFVADCFMLKDDLVAYLESIKKEHECSVFRNRRNPDFLQLWHTRMEKIKALKSNAINFSVSDQVNIKGPRGYVKSHDEGFQLIREISLSLVSYLSVIHVKDINGRNKFYWKLFVDYDYFEEKAKALINYGQKKNQKKYSRDGQGKYRRLLLEECPRCPITHVADSALLMASHIKPWRVSSIKEKTDPKNGFILSPLYDKLFDKGYITFSDDKKMHISKWLSDESQNLLKLNDNECVEDLPLDEKRKEYLEYHRKYVFKG